MRLDVYNATNTTKLGELSAAHDIGFTADLRVPGALVFSVDAASTADRALLKPWRVVRVHRPGTGDLEAYRVQDMPAEVRVADERPYVSYQCRHLLSDLGFQQGGAVLWPQGGLDGLQQSPRWFGPMGWDHQPDGREAEPTTGGIVQRLDWPEPEPWLTERVVFAERIVMRRELAAAPSFAGPSRMVFTTAWWTKATVWLDGVEVAGLRTQVGETITKAVDLVYDGEPHVVCIIAEGEPPATFQNSLAWMWAQADVDSDGNVEWGSRIFSSFNSITFDGPTPPTVPYWEAWSDIDPPGVTCGFVSQTWLDEAKDRGLLTWLTADYDENNDSAINGWSHRFSRAFPLMKGGQLHDQLEAFGAEVHVTPNGTLQLFEERGENRTATVTISTAFALSAAGQGPQATRYLFETDAGISTAAHPTAETEWGIGVEDIASFPNDLGPHDVLDVVAEQLVRDAGFHNEIDVDLPDDLVPYADLGVGDRVRCVADVDGTEATMRVTALMAAVIDTGHVEWSAFLEPYEDAL
jgi:hypothetical protein